MKNKVVFRALGGVLAGIMSASMLTGCGSSGTGGTGSSSGDGTSSGNVLRALTLRSTGLRRARKSKTETLPLRSMAADMFTDMML